jgi:hypothetical protein
MDDRHSQEICRPELISTLNQSHRSKLKSKLLEIHLPLRSKTRLSLDCLVLVQCAGEAEGQKASQGKSLTSVRFTVGNRLPSDRLLHFEQVVHGMGKLSNFERVHHSIIVEFGRR